MRRFAAFGAIGVFAIFAVCGRMSCEAIGDPPLVVTPAAMIRLYRDNPEKANAMYEGRRIMLPLRNGKYHLLDFPPIIVSEPPASGRTSVTIGVVYCRRDGVYTGDRCHFTLVIESASHHD